MENGGSELELLVEASSRLLSPLSLAEVLSSILDLASRTIRVDAYSIWRRLSDGTWRPVVSNGLSQSYIDTAAPQGSITGVIVFHDIGTHPLLEGRRALYEAEGLKALLVNPLSIHGEMAGTLVFYCRRPHVFNDTELKLASAIANLAGAAITNAELRAESEESHRRTAFLAEASQILASSLNYETTLQAVAHLAIGYMADWCTVDVADPDSGPPRRVAIAHREPGKIAWAEELRRRYPPDESESAGRVIRTGESVLVNGIEDAQLAAAARDDEHLRLLRELRPAAFMSVPMRARDTVLGALSFLTAESGRRYSESDVAFARDLANRCALAIDNARLYSAATSNADRERESRTELEILQRVGQVVSAELNLERLVQAVTDAATEVTGARFGSFFYNVLDGKGGSYMLYTLSGVSREKFAQFPMPRATALFGPTFQGEGIVRSGNVKADLRYGHSEPYRGMPPGHLPVVSYLAVPVAARSGEVIGGLFFGHEDADVFTERHERIVAGIAAQAGIAVENARLLDSVQRARQEVSDAHEQLSHILESASDAFIALDREWRITHTNARGAALVSGTPPELIGRDIRELIDGANGERVIEAFGRAAGTAAPVQFEITLEPSGVALDISVFPTRFGLAVFGRDVTEKKRFEDQLRQTAKLESLGVLAGGIAHDFNNILVGILGNACLALDELPDESPIRESLTDVIAASERAASLTQQMLAYAGKGRFVIQPLNLSDLLVEMAALLQASVPRSVQLRVEPERILPSVEADAAQIQQLLMNLIINGAEAIGENQAGTVTVTTKVQDVDEDYIRRVLTPGEIEPGRFVVVEVTDTGCGMDSDTLARIFDPFFTTKFTGRGLGLAAALGIVRGHHGALKVYSRPGQGSTFKVLFPASDEAAAAAPQEPTERIATGTGLVLVVDDEDIVRRMAAKTLERFGFQVLTAQDGSEAVRIYESMPGKIGLVLLDLTMPVMGGEEALRRLKTIDPGARVVLSSGFNEAEAIERFTGQGLTGFLQKPYTAAALISQVRSGMNGEI